MLLSIITINYNDAEGLKRTIASVKAQTCRDFQYIVIDGGSSDGSREVIEQAQEGVDCWVSEPDRGIYHAMNKGVARAAGDYCLFLNAGDALHDEEVVAQTLPFLQKGAADYFTGHTVQQRGKKGDKAWLAPPRITAYFLVHEALSHQSTFIRTALLKRTGYREDFRIVSDWGQMVEAFLFHDARYEALPFYVSRFAERGISGHYALDREERERFLKELFPSRYLLDAVMGREDNLFFKSKRMDKAQSCLQKGGVAGDFKLLRNTIKWLVADLFRL